MYFPHTHTHRHTSGDGAYSDATGTRPLQDGYPDPTLVGMLSRAMQMTLAMTPWPAVMATHQEAGMWSLAGGGGGGGWRMEGEKKGVI